LCATIAGHYWPVAGKESCLFLDWPKGIGRMVVNTNIAATRTAAQLNEQTRRLSTSLARLSSGSKIIQPQDDAAGLAQSIKFGSQSTRLNAAISNNTNFFSLLNTQEALSSKITNALNRMSELAILYADMTKTTEDKANYMLEFDQLQESIYGAEIQKFNGVDTFITEGKVFNSADGESVTLESNKLAGALIGQRGEYDIVISYEANDEGKEFTDEHKEVFNRAAHRVSSIIKGAVNTSGNTDLTITAKYKDSADSDGVGGTLASAGATSSYGSGMPATGTFTIDEADMDNMSDGNYLYSTVLHEMLHIVGFNSSHPNFSGTVYNGAKGIEKYNEIMGTSVTQLSIEDGGGAGTAFSHWEEDDFDNEIMTGYSEGANGVEPLSEFTVGALEDYGYEMQYDVADEWEGPGTGTATTPLLISKVESVKTAIQSIAETRANIGAQISYVKKTIDSLQIEKSNLDQATSRIVDTDVAEESMKYARQNVLVNSATSMLAQANVLPQLALQLLG